MNVLNQEITDRFSLYHSDCVDGLRGLPDNSIDFSIYSPPFESLYVFSNSERDMGNSASSADFWQHYRYLIAEMYRAMKPGRLVAIHAMNLPTSKVRDGFIGIKDFRGEIIRAHINDDAADLYTAIRRLEERAQMATLNDDQQRAIRLFDAANVMREDLAAHPGDTGFIYHSEVCIWKNPVVAMQRTKALGLLYKQVKKDSAMSRQGIADYLIVMCKPGVNPDPVTHTPDDFNVDKWQQYASPVWMDIDQGRTLQYMSARDSDDERHISPLQTQVVERAVELWTNPNDIVLTPFGWIGTELVVPLRMGRRAVGFELKRSYYDLAVRNCREAKADNQNDLFADTAG